MRIRPSIPPDLALRVGEVFVDRPSVTIIIPVKDEEESLRQVLEGVKPYGDEILVVDGHSQDRSQEIAQALGARVILDNGKGKGDALRVGIRQARGDTLVFIDADGSHDPADIPSILAPLLRNEADHVSGSRMLGGSDELHSTLYEFIRLMGNQIVTLGINYRFNVRLTDCQNGFRAIRTEVARQLDLQENIATIEQEMIIKTIKKGYRLVEVPTHEYRRKGGRSKVRLRKVWFRFVYSWLKYLFF